MGVYQSLKYLIFLLPPEFSHNVAVKMLKYNLIPKGESFSHPMLSNNIFDLQFANPVGLAAGFDKNAECIPALFNQNFGFVEIGTVTPMPQIGSAKPRIFRLTSDRAIINRLGFNNKGGEYIYNNISNLHYNQDRILGVNISKNKNTLDYKKDYIHLLEKFYGLADYITINISSPNTPNLRILQKKNYLDSLLNDLTECRFRLSDQYNKHCPLLIKIAPDLTIPEVVEIANLCKIYKIDGLIISNTTINQREKLSAYHKDKIGGLSGAPLQERSNIMLSAMYRATEGKIPIIGVGGIFNAVDAYQKIRLGASLVQIYTAIIYQGFAVVNQINKELVNLLKQDGLCNIKEAIGSAYR